MLTRCIAAVAALSLFASHARADDSALKAGVFDPPRAAPEFTLAGSNGAELKLSAYRGKVVLLGFGFTQCKAVCPITLGTLAQAIRKLGAQSRDVQVIYVTVDPEHDDAAAMNAYLAHFSASFVGGTGSAEQLAAVRKDYGIAAEKVAGPDGAYTHSSFIYLIDRAGRLRALMPFAHTADDYAHDVRLLLAEP